MTNKVALTILKMEKNELMSKPEPERDWELITALDIAIDTLRPQGEWISKELYGCTCLQCNQCGKADFDIKYDNFCPNCGADMRKETDDDK